MTLAVNTMNAARSTGTTPPNDQSASIQAGPPSFSRSMSMDSVRAKPAADGLFSAFRRAPYGEVRNREMIETNQQHLQTLFNHVWGAQGLNNKYVPPTPLDAHVRVGSTNHRIFVANLGRELQFFAPTLNSSRGGFNPQALASFANNQPPQYFNGLKEDDPVISMMAMSALSKLQ